MKLIKRGGMYWVDFRDPAGQRHRKSTGISASAVEPAKAEATAFEEAGRIVQKYMAAGDKPATPVVHVPTLAVMLHARLDQHWQHMAYGKTMKFTVRKLAREVGSKPVTEVNEKWLRELANGWIKGGLAVSTVNRHMNAIKGVLKVAVEDKLIAALPRFPSFSEARLVRERYMLDHEEAAILSWLARMQDDDVAAARWEWEWLHNLVVFLTDTGFRFSEAFVFTLVDGKADLAHGVTKNTIGRRIPLTRRALAAAQYLLGHSHTADLYRLGLTKPKGPWDWVSYRLDQCLKALRINTKDTPRRARLTLHCLRHTCASRMLAGRNGRPGVNIVIVSKWLGHSSIKVTMRYLKLEQGAFDAGLASLEAPIATTPSAESLHGTPSLHVRKDSSGRGTGDLQ